ncbi:hypothetical protein NG2371_01252 [Nocardia gamkensis]|nr:hypothetical protein [Nocardia gamkensis]
MATLLEKAETSPRSRKPERPQQAASLLRFFPGQR